MIKLWRISSICHIRTLLKSKMCFFPMTVVATCHMLPCVWPTFISSLPLAEASLCFRPSQARCQLIVMLSTSYKPICHALLMLHGYCCVCCLQQLHHRKLTDVIRQDLWITFASASLILDFFGKLVQLTHAWLDFNYLRNESCKSH